MDRCKNYPDSRAAAGRSRGQSAEVPETLDLLPADALKALALGVLFSPRSCAEH